VDIRTDNVWVLAPAMREVVRLAASVVAEGLILPGGEVPVPATLETPFLSAGELEALFRGYARRGGCRAARP
jgi:hypothetical protein